MKAGNEPCSYHRRALDDSISGIGGMKAPARVFCDHGGRIHGYCMLESAENISIGQADPRPYLACQSE